MSGNMKADRHETAKVVDFVTRERAKVLSFREFKHRLRGYGYCIDEKESGPVIATLPRHVEVCALPPELCA